MGLATFKIVAATAPRHHIYPQSLPCGARLLNWHAIAIADQLHLQAIQNLPVVVVTAMTATVTSAFRTSFFFSSFKNESRRSSILVHVFARRFPKSEFYGRAPQVTLHIRPPHGTVVPPAFCIQAAEASETSSGKVLRPKRLCHEINPLYHFRCLCRSCAEHPLCGFSQFSKSAF